jgi:diguanylate cyclase (GGDEF)-like protein/PAS domain S-box-containing protein
MAGYAPADFMSGPGFDDVVFEPDRPVASRLHSIGGQAEYRIVRADGRIVPIVDACEVSGRGQRRVRGILVERRSDQMAPLDSAGSQLLGRMPFVTYIDRIEPRTRSRVRLYTSPHIFPLIGYTPDELVSDATLWSSLLAPSDGPPRPPTDVLPERTLRSEYPMRTRDGRTIWVRDEGCLHRDDSSAAEYIYGVVRDVTEEHEAQVRTRLVSSRDPLTMLLNRSALGDALAVRIREARRLDEDLSLLLLDLDDFKHVNDALGHPFGDRLLIAVARRLERSFRADDVVARLGGDEFAAVLRGVSLEDACRIAREIAETIEAPFLIDGRQVAIAASVGVASLACRPALTEGDLMRLAEVAMYSAKRRHSRVVAYETDQRVSPNGGADFSRLGEMHSGIGRHEFVLVYQPWLRASDGKVDACEALLRWNHPFRGTVSPGDFLPLAERAGLIRELDLIALDLACRQTAAWRDAGLNMRVAVNASRESLLDEEYGRQVGAALSRYGLGGPEIEIEITEQGVLGDPGQAARFAERLDRIGVKLALDDFGTGYSSFAQLRELKVSTLKIDQSFVSGALAREKDAAIVETIISLGHKLDKDVVAEGVENVETLNHLRVLGADYIQGYAVARPMPAEELPAWLAAYEPPTSDEIAQPKPLSRGRKRLAA